MKAAEDFLSVVLHAFITTAGEVVKSSSTTQNVEEVAKAVVDTFVTVKCCIDHSQLQLPTASPDGVQAYAKEVLTLGLVWWGFHDAIREGDGECVITYWKFLLLLFKGDGCRNYSLEAAKLLLGTITMSPQQSAVLQWSRFVNTHGRDGCNIPMDLHLEHLNRRFKTALAGLHSNITPKSINRIGRSLGVVNHICSTLEQELHLRSVTDYHPVPSYQKDFQLVMDCICEAKVFDHVAARVYNTHAFTCGRFQQVNLSGITDWLRTVYRKL